MPAVPVLQPTQNTSSCWLCNSIFTVISQHLLATFNAEAWSAVPAVLNLAHAQRVELLERHRTMLLKAAADAGNMDL